MHRRAGPQFNCGCGLHIRDPGIELGPVPLIRLLSSMQFVVSDPASTVRWNKRQVVASGSEFCETKVSFVICRGLATVLQAFPAVFRLPALRSNHDSLNRLAALVLHFAVD